MKDFAQELGRFGWLKFKEQKESLSLNFNSLIEDGHRLIYNITILSTEDHQLQIGCEGLAIRIK